jgi:prepilin signal peptidase PulO-like enzyme (type II secretory pathway)
VNDVPAQATALPWEAGAAAKAERPDAAAKAESARTRAEDERPTDAEIRAAWQRPEVLFPAGVLALVALVHLGLNPHGVIGAGFTATLVVVAAIDLRYGLIPNRIVLPAAGAVLLLQISFYPGDAAEWLAASLGAALFLFLPSLINASGIGMGDVKLALLLGAMLGGAVIGALMIAFLSLWPIAIYLFVTEGWGARKRSLPLGPSLAFGSILVLLLSG